MKSFKKSMAVAAMSVAVTSAFAAGGPGVEHRSQKFLEALEAHGGTPIEQMQPADARNVLVGAQASVKLQLPKAQVSERTIEQDGQKVKLTVVRPANAKGKTAAFVFIHGGGWILGDYPTHERLVRDLVSSSGATAVFVNYSPSPEARYPVAINEIYAATKWVAQHGDQIGVDGSRLAVAGNSVGGNMAAAISQMAKDKGGPKIRFQLLMWPVTDATLVGLPASTVITAEIDPLRSEGCVFAERLKKDGVSVEHKDYAGVPHEFFGWAGVSSKAREAQAFVNAELRQAFGTTG